MPGDPAQRSAKYAAKVTGERMFSDWTKRVGGMKQNAATVQNEIVQTEGAVRTVLNAAGVPTIMYPFYLNFGRELYARVRRGMAGESLRQEAAVLIAKWVAQTLTQSVLEAIRDDVFSIGAPVGP